MDADVINRFRPIRQTRAAMLVDPDKLYEVARVWGDAVDEVLLLERDCSGEWKLPSGIGDLTYLLATCCDDLPANIDPAPITDCMIYAEQLIGGGGDAAYHRLCDARPKAVEVINRMMRCVTDGFKQEPPADTKADNVKKTLPPHDVNNCARYIREQRQRIAEGKRLKATKRALIAEFLGCDDTASMERQFRRDRYGWLLDIR